MQLFRGNGGFTTSKTASADRHANMNLMLYCLTAWSHERGRFLPTMLDATEPLTPLSRAPDSTLTPRAPSCSLLFLAVHPSLGWANGSEDAESAKTSVDAFS